MTQTSMLEHVFVMDLSGWNGEMCLDVVAAGWNSGVGVSGVRVISSCW